MENKEQLNFDEMFKIMSLLVSPSIKLIDTDGSVEYCDLVPVHKDEIGRLHPSVVYRIFARKNLVDTYGNSVPVLVGLVMAKNNSNDFIPYGMKYHSSYTHPFGRKYDVWVNDQLERELIIDVPPSIKEGCAPPLYFFNRDRSVARLEYAKERSSYQTPSNKNQDPLDDIYLY